MSKNFNLEVTYDFAVKKLAALQPHIIAERSGCPYDEERKVFTVEYLANTYHVTFPDGRVALGQGGEVPLATQIMLLHYLINAKGTPIRGEFISYKEIPDGRIYIEPFTKRAIKPLVDNFGQAPDKLVEAAAKLGGEKVKAGHVAVTVPVFPRIAITYVLWLGDEEFPPSGSVLFDASAPDYLPTEDYAVLAQTVIWYLVKSAA